MFEPEDLVVHRVKTVLNAVVHSEASLPAVGKQRTDRLGHECVDQDGKWKRLFTYYDDDHGGALSFKEFKKLIRGALHINESKLPDKDLMLLFQRIDSDGSGEIEYGEFTRYVKLGTRESQELPRTLGRALRLALARQKIRTEVDLRETFESLDFDASGGITLHQLRRLIRETLRLNKYEFSDYYVKRLMTNIDVDNTGQIEFDEFAKFINDHVNLGGISNTGYAGPGTAKPYAANEVISKISSVKAPPSHESTGFEQTVVAAGEKQRSFAAIRPAGRRPAPYTGDQRPRGYLNLPGAERLNKVEGRLFNAGFDIRGEFFRVGDDAGEGRARPARLDRFASAPSLVLLSPGEEPAAQRGSRVHDPGRTTKYLRHVSKKIL
jgi:Ca2+-binding EF-hand superfamily protein